MTKQFTSDTSLSNQSPGTVYDNAGNSAVCPANQTVLIRRLQVVIVLEEKIIGQIKM